MLAPSPPPEEVHANAAFDALLWALSRPGRERGLPAPGEGPLIAALIDRECRVFAEGEELRAALAATGAALGSLEDADHAFLGEVSDAGVLKRLRQGSDLYPDDGATVVIRARLDEGERLRLTGPGVDGAQELRAAGLPAGFWRLRADVMRYPTGFEIALIDGDRLVAIPRSTAVEVL